MADLRPRDESFEALEEVIREATFRSRIFVKTPEIKKILELAIQKRAPEKEIDVVIEDRREEDDLVLA